MRLLTWPATAWLHFWRAFKYWHFLHYSWRLSWHKARRAS